MGNFPPEVASELERFADDPWLKQEVKKALLDDWRPYDVFLVY